MTVMRDAAGVTRGAGHIGWPLLPPLPVGEPRPRIATVPSARATAPAAASAPEVDDLVAVAAALNDGPGSVVYIDSRDMLRALSTLPWTCPNCTGENDMTFAYCPGCGTRKP